jgi:predicted ester cyclase
MKKASGIILKILLGLILVIFILLFTVPVVFKGKIKTKVEMVINQSVNAKVSFGDYKLGFFRNFPKLTFSLEDLVVAGTGRFQNDTLASFRSMDLVFNLSSLFKKSGYEINSVRIDEANVKALVLKDGAANWDIMKESCNTTTTAGSSSGSQMKILLQKLNILNSSIAYIDSGSNVSAYLDKVNFDIRGDMTTSTTNLQMLINAGEVTFMMNGMKYLNKMKADAKINVLANLDSMKFNLQENYIAMNDLKLNFAGMVAMPGDDIITDLTFDTETASLKSLLSLIPAVYLSAYKDLKTSGYFKIEGSAKGRYSDADSTMPDIDLKLSINNGLIIYPSLPEQIKNISLKSNLFYDGRKTDNSTVDITRFHMELAGNPFDMNFSLKTPVSDPDFAGSMNGKIDLAALSKALPLDSISLSGLVNMSVNMAGRMSMIEKKQYDRFRASGNMNLSKMMVSMTGYPEISINEAGFEFSPQYAALRKADLKIGSKSDFALSGQLENYIPYIFRNETIRGNLSMHSKVIDMTEIMSMISKMAQDTTSQTDTTSLAVIRVPENINFNFDAVIDKFKYNKINVSNVKGHIIVKNGILSLKETNMELLGGLIKMNADYDTRDSLKPTVKADLDIENLAIKDAFNTFNTIQKLAPTANGIDGRVGVKMSYSSLLGRDLMPVITSITGSGKLQTSEVTLVESAVYKKMKETFKLGEGYSNTFKDLNVSFRINNGRIIVSPFTTKAGNVKMNISGDQGIDQTINYVVKTEIPRSDLGGSVNSLINTFSAQAAAFGIAIKPAEIMKVNVKITGTFRKPVITPFFGNTPPDSTAGTKTTVKETVKQVVDSRVDQAKEKAKAEAEQQGDKLIKEAEEKGQQLHNEAVKAAEKIRQEADTQGKKLISEAESKGPLAAAAAKKTAEKLNKEADKRATQVVKEADDQSQKLVDDAKVKKEELINKP